MKLWRGVVLAAGICLVFAGTARAQSQITAGVIQGTVEDPSGAIVPGAHVVATDLDTNLERAVDTSRDGRFVLLALPPGRYTLKVSKQGFATILQENISLTVGQTITLPLTLRISPGAQQVVVTATPLIDTTNTASASTLNTVTVANTPVLGRKFEDLLTLTPGVSIVQGPDGDEINFNGQRGIFNNISLDGGDYNNGFFGEQYGGQRAAIDITLDAVKEFQVIAAGAPAEFGRTAAGVVNVITKSGTNEVHGSVYHFQRLEALASSTSDGKPLTDFHREQFGGTIGGPIVKSKMFYFASAEGITSNLTRDNLSAPLGPPCSVPNPVVGVNDGVIAASVECQRVALLNFFQQDRNQAEGAPVEHPIRNANALGKFDWNVTSANRFSASYNFDYSKNRNQTFDVPTYGDSANGIEGPSKIQALSTNLFTAISGTKLNEFHFTYSRENRPRSAVTSNVPADTAMGFVTTFRFGNPFFLEPKIDELLWRTQVRDNFSIISGKHNIKFGGEWLHTNNGQVFRGFFTGRYIFSDTVGFLHYASPSSMGTGFGPTAAECADGTFTDISMVSGGMCPNGSGFTGGPLLFYLQDGVPTGLISIPPGASTISNEDYGLFLQDQWQVTPGFTLNYGLRWDAQIFPDDVVPPSRTAFGIFLSNPAFRSDGTEHNQKKEFQPRVGFAWDVRNNGKSVLRASWGIYNALQNMLTQVGSITTNGVQQHTIFADTALALFGVPTPTWPDPFPATTGNPTCPGPPANSFPCLTGVRVFSKDYANPRLYTTTVTFEQELQSNWAVYANFVLSKGVHLTRFFDANNGSPDPTATAFCASLPGKLVPPGVCIPNNGDSAVYPGPGLFNGTGPLPVLGEVFVTASPGKSLYRGFTVGVKKRFSHGFQMEGNYTLSYDYDDDSNERDPFTDRTFDRFDLQKDYGFSDRDERHKFNFITYSELPWGFTADVRMQAHSAQPITPEPRVLDGVDRGRNSIRKNNEFFSFDWRVTRPIRFGERIKLIPMFEMFNTFNNDNNINPLVTPGLFNFDGFLREGVGDPRQAEFALKLTF